MKTSDVAPLLRFVVTSGLLVIFLAGTVMSKGIPAGAPTGTSYYPLAVGNWWVYVFGGHSKMVGKTIKWIVNQKEVLHEAPAYYLSSIPALGEDEPYILSPVTGGIVEADTERFLFKYPLKTGARWSARAVGSAEKADAFEVVSVGRPCSAGVRSFNDCATIREVNEAIDFVTMVTYARGVGPVKYVYFKGLHSKEIDTTLTISSWKVQQ